MSAIALFLGYQLPPTVRGGAESLKGSDSIESRRKVAKNLRALPFIKDSFSKIYIAEQYLYTGVLKKTVIFDFSILL